MGALEGEIASVTPVGSLTIDSDTSDLIVTTSPNAEVLNNNAGVVLRFYKQINVRGLTLIWLPSKPPSESTQTEAESSTASTLDTAQGERISVSLKVQIQQYGDLEFRDLTDESTETSYSQVREEYTSLLFLFSYLK